MIRAQQDEVYNLLIIIPIIINSVDMLITWVVDARVTSQLGLP